MDNNLKSFKSWFSEFFRRSGHEDSVREAIEDLIEDTDHDATILETEERNLLSNILSLKGRTVSDVMVPRADISAVEVNSSFADLVELMNREAHSRVPIFQKTLDHAIGMVHIKDAMAANSEFEASTGYKDDEEPHLKNMIRDVLFVSPSMQVLELLLEMRAKRIHMALVVDEFGGVDGLVTIEDLVEEIVGEIEDEHDQDEEPQLILTGSGIIEADARVLIEDFEAKVGEVLSEEEREEFDTLGGLIFSIAGRVPIRGELVKHSSGMEIEIVDADPRRIKRIRIRGLKVELSTDLKIDTKDHSLNEARTDKNDTDV